MCISAEASFVLSGVLLPVGVHCMQSARRRDRSTLPLAAVPFFFGIQQLLEGLVWLGINNNHVALRQHSAAVYLFFALAFWPFWIPFSAAALESRSRIRTVILLTAAVGSIAGLSFSVPMLVHPDEIGVRVAQHSIYYGFSVPPLLAAIPELAWHIGYLITMALPLFLVARGRRSLVAFSVILVLSAVLSHAVFLHAFASVWCFFAAVLSLILARMFHVLPSAEQLPAAASPSP